MFFEFYLCTVTFRFEACVVESCFPNMFNIRKHASKKRGVLKSTFQYIAGIVFVLTSRFAFLNAGF